ncbi:MAG: UDP-N-acetylmuramoyl-L-alanine--D-glutamate ligase [Firmicutes bacterium]|nr:UDP-N-acetylmuramoyl-L-alanine--D-glutamate ligase [Bacillota bacterium]
MEIKNKRVLVVGAGLSGLAVSRFLLRHGADVTLYDGKNRDKLSPEIDSLQAQGCHMLLGNALPQMEDWHWAVVSPGVPPMIPFLNMCREAGIPVIGELELAYRISKSPFIAITGTNGKTTTTSLTGYMLQQAGVNVLVGGNIGMPLVDEVENFSGWIVAEVSSFQLESCYDFAPHIACHLNLTPDHLDRHGTLENYAAMKEKIFARQKETDFAVMNHDDPLVRLHEDQWAAQKRYFSLQTQVEQGAYVQDGAIYMADHGESRHLIDTKDVYIKGSHNWQNAMAAVEIARVLDIDPRQIAASLRTFPGVEHRLEFVIEKNGVTYVNDSKGTNPASTAKALNAYDQPIVLIAGGYDKGADFLPLMELIKEKVRYMVLLGATAPKIKKAADQAGFSDYRMADSFEDAVRLAEAAARPGDVLLLSPACASWDMFSDYEQRGKLFKRLVTA